MFRIIEELRQLPADDYRVFTTKDRPVASSFPKNERVYVYKMRINSIFYVFILLNSIETNH